MIMRKGETVSKNQPNIQRRLGLMQFQQSKDLQIDDLQEKVRDLTINSAIKDHYLHIIICLNSLYIAAGCTHGGETQTMIKTSKDQLATVMSQWDTYVKELDAAQVYINPQILQDTQEETARCFRLSGDYLGVKTAEQLIKLREAIGNANPRLKKIYDGLYFARFEPITVEMATKIKRLAETGTKLIRACTLVAREYSVSTATAKSNYYRVFPAGKGITPVAQD